MSNREALIEQIRDLEPGTIFLLHMGTPEQPSEVPFVRVGPSNVPGGHYGMARIRRYVETGARAINLDDEGLFPRETGLPTVEVLWSPR